MEAIEKDKKFIVSARKYRPATFDTVVGQSHITTTLKNALKTKQLAQAFLFCGPRGVGKTTCARILAKTINCQNITPEYEACGTCESCEAFQHNASLNVYELDAASNNSVDDIRNLVDQVRFPPQIGNKKVYIIDEVHMLSTAAFNAFLKTLEEPPSYVIFILATTEKHKIIPTILSRCQIFDFKRIENKDISEHLANIAQREHIEAEIEALDLIAKKADGGLRDALSLFDLVSTFSVDRKITYKNTLENLHILDYEYYFRVTDALLAKDIPRALLLLDDIMKQGFDGHLFISGLATHLRDLVYCKDATTLTLLQVNQNAKEKYQLQAAEASLAFLYNALDKANDCDLNYKNSKNPELLLQLTLIKIAHLPEMIQQQEEAKKKIDVVTETPPVEYGKNSSSTPNNTNVTNQTIKTPSIKTGSNNYNSNTQTNTTAETVANKVDLTKPYSHEALQKAWQNLASSAEYDTIKFIFNTPLTVLSENRYEITLENEVIKNRVEASRVAMQSYLHQVLQNNTIQLSIKVVVSDKPVKPIIYTSSDKWKALHEKNEHLGELKNRLQLLI